MEDNQLYLNYKNKLFLIKEIYAYQYLSIDCVDFSIPNHFNVEYVCDTSDDDFKIIKLSRYISRDKRYSVCKRQGWKCNFCNTKLKWDKNSTWDGEIAHVDHIHPYSKRATYQNGEININEDANIQALCPSCNLSKSKKEIN